MIRAQRSATIAPPAASYPQSALNAQQGAAAVNAALSAEAAMFRKLLLCVLLALLGLGALQAGADRFLLLGFAGLAALGLLGRGDRPGRS
jgi:hypothetical protein